MAGRTVERVRPSEYTVTLRGVGLNQVQERTTNTTMAGLQSSLVQQGGRLLRLGPRVRSGRADGPAPRVPHSCPAFPLPTAGDIVTELAPGQGY